MSLVFCQVTVYIDMKNNVPAAQGQKAIGTRIKPDVEMFRAYPPVVGIDVNATDSMTQSLRNSQFQTATNDPKAGNFGDFTQYEGGRYVVKWVPPAEWSSTNDVNIANGYYNNFSKIDHGYIPGTSTVAPGLDISHEQLMPPNLSLVQVVTTSAYIADVSIFDHLGHFVRHFRQAFGYLGEFSNPERSAPKGFKSYLIWDLHDNKGRLVGQGAYIWKTNFVFEDRSQKIKFTRMGVVRQNP
jgi:AraC-like DNA-binding protein